MKIPPTLHDLTSGSLSLAKVANAAILQLALSFDVILRCPAVAWVNNATKKERCIALHPSAVLQSVVTGSRVFFLPMILQVILLSVTPGFHNDTSVQLY